MGAYSRIVLLMMLVFGVIYGLGASLYLHQARLDVARELEAASRLASLLAAPGQASTPGELRHMRPLDSNPQDEPDGAVPAWFAALLVDQQNASTREVGGWRIEPADEIEEIWEGFILLSLSFSVGMVLCFTVLYWVVRRVTRPLKSLEEAMTAVGEGCLSSRLPRQSVSELDQLVDRFNTMAVALETEQRTVGRLLNELLQLQDRERAHIARVLHDDLGQYLTGMRAQARSWVHDPELNDRQKAQARELAGHCQTVQEHFRHLLQDLHPLVMEQLGLGCAIRHLAEQWKQLSGLGCELNVDNDLPVLSDDQQTHLYRFLQEALNNISRHANASFARLGVVSQGSMLRVEVADNGTGSVNLVSNAGLGIRSMQERARCLGGGVEFLSTVGWGTRVCLTMPL